jgi:hypothetical protein
MQYQLWTLFVLSALLPAQTPENARARLMSTLRHEKAWGVYETGRLHSRDLHQDLIDQLRDAASLATAEPGTSEFAFVAVLFDSLIESGVTVPSTAIEPFLENWTSPALILLARAPENQKNLLSLSATTKSDLVWLAANNILAKHKSQLWFDDLLKQLRITHQFIVSEHLINRFGGTKSGGCGGYRPVSIPDAFPPTVFYVLKLGLSRDENLLVSGPQSVSYARILARPGAVTSVVDCSPPIDRDDVTLHYLADLSGMNFLEIERSVRASTPVIYTTDANFAAICEESLTDQKHGIQRVLNEIAAKGLTNNQRQFLLEIKVVVISEKGDKRLPKKLNKRTITLN